MTTLREKQLVRKEFANSFYLTSFQALVCGYPRGTGKGLQEDRKGTRVVRGWYLESFSGGGPKQRPWTFFYNVFYIFI